MIKEILFIISKNILVQILPHLFASLKVSSSNLMTADWIKSHISLWPFFFASSWLLEFFIYKRSPYQNAIFVRFPSKIVWQLEWSKKPRTTYFLTFNKNTETVGLSLWNDRILAFIGLNRLKTSSFNVMTQYFHQNISSA